MTRRKNAAVAEPKAEKTKKTKKSPKIPGVELAIRKNFGHDPVMYGDDPPKREIRNVRIDTIKVDYSYQREFRRAHAERIASNFDIQKMGIPLLNDRSGRLFCVDGQHSIHAIRAINSLYPGFLTSIRCEVVSEAGPKQEADLFVGRNNRAKMPPTNTFKAEHRSGNSTCIRVANILHSRGLSVSGMRIPDTLSITCIVPVCWAHRMGVLEESIDVIKSTWGLIDEAFKVTCFHPIAVVIHKNNGGFDFVRLVDVLKKFTPRGLEATANTTAGHKRTVNIANRIIDAYNKSRGVGKKLAEVNGADIA